MDRPASVLYLMNDGLTDQLGQSQVLPYLEGLSARGFSISIISLEKREPYRALADRIRDQCRNSGIQWYPLTYHKRPSILATVVDLYRIRTLARKLCRETQFRVIHCRSYPTSLIGLHLKRKFGLFFLFDMRGFWADERMEGGLWSSKNPVHRIIYAFFKRQERLFFREANHIVSLTENAKRIIQKISVDTPVTVIPTCVDLNFFDPQRQTHGITRELKTKMKIEPDDFVLLYLGSWATWYMTREMLDFFTVLKKKKPDAKFLILTKDRVELEGFPYRSDCRVAYVSRNEVPSYISLATASVFFIKPGFSKKASAATKMGELLAMNIPFITNPGWGDVEEILAASHCGILVQSFRESEYDQAVQDLLSGEARGDLREVAKTYYSLEKGIQSYYSIYTSESRAFD